MTLPTWYSAGTVSVESESTTVTLTGGYWGDDNIMPGDLFCDPAQPLVPPQRITGVVYDDVLEKWTAELWAPWPGTDMVEAAYEVRYVGIIERSTAQTRKVLEQLGDVKAWADVFVATDADRLALESPTNPLPAGRRVMVTEDGLIWVKKTGAHDDWLPPASFKGDTGNKGWSPVHSIAVDGARRVWQLVDWIGGEGAKPTGAGKYVGATGLVDDIADGINVRGPAGDLTGVTPFWQTRITTDDTASAARAGLGSDPKNLIHNPGMQVWQNPWWPRPDMPHRWVLADGFLFGNNSGAGTAKFTGTKVETGLPAGVQRALRVECTTAESTLGTDSEAHIRYVVPAPRAALFKDATLNLKFSVRTNKLGTYTATVLNEARTAGFVFEYTVTAADTWQEFTVAVDMSGRLGTWNFTDSGYGIGIRWGLLAAPGFRAPGTGWQSGNIIGGPNQVNLADAVGNYWELTKIQFCAGSLPPFSLPDYEEVWAESQNQYRVINTTSGGVNILGWGAFDNAVNFDLLLERPMYAPPHVDIYNLGGTASDLQEIDGTSVGVSGAASFARSKNVAKFTISAASSITVGTPYMLRLVTSSAVIVLDGHY